MAIKKFLMENGKQVWPITRADCIYTVAGDQLLNTVVDANTKAIADEVARAEAAEKAINDEIANMKNAELDGSLANLIADEASRAANAEKALADRLDVIEGEATVEGSIKKAVADEAARVDEIVGKAAEGENAATGLRKEIADAVKVEEERAKGVEEGLDERLAAVEASVGDGGDIEQRVQNLEDDLAKQKDPNQEGTLANLIADEVTRAGEAEGALADRIAAFEGDENKEGSVKQQIKAAIDQEVLNRDAAILVETNRAKGVEEGFETRIKANENFVAAQPAIDEAQDDRIKALEDANKEGGDVANAIKAAQDAADAAQADVDAVEKRLDDEGGLVDRLETVEQFVDNHDDTERDAQIAANKAAIDKLNGAADVEGSVAKAVKDAVDAEATARGNADTALSNRIAVFEANGANDVAALTERVAANEEDIARLDGAVDVEGSVKKQIKDAIDEVNGAAEELEGRVKANEDKLAGLENATVKAEIEAAQAAAEKHADDAITALVDSAPDAMNTLNELATAINANKGVYDAYVEQHATAMATMKSELQAEIDADVLVEANRAKGVEEGLQNDIDAINDAEDGILAQAKAHAEAQDTALHTTISAEIDADVKVVADALANEKDADVEGSLANLIAALQAQLGAHLTTDSYDGDKEHDDIVPKA